MLTTKDVSEILHVSEETVRRWIRNKELRATLEGKSYFVDKGDLLKLIERKSKSSSTSLGKLDAILPGGLQTILKAGVLGLAAPSGASKLLNKLSEKINKQGSIIDDTLTHSVNENVINQESAKTYGELHSHSLIGRVSDQIEAYGESKTVNESSAVKFINELSFGVLKERIELLEIQKRELEIEFQTKLLKIDKEIFEYKKLKNQLSQEDGKTINNS